MTTLYSAFDPQADNPGLEVLPVIRKRSAVREEIALIERRLRLLEARKASLERSLGIDGSCYLEAKALQRRVVEVVSARSGISAVGILGRGRTRPLAEARLTAMVIVYAYSEAPEVVVGRLFRRDHGTVRHALLTISARYQTEKRTRQFVDQCLRDLALDPKPFLNRFLQ